MFRVITACDDVVTQIWEVLAQVLPQLDSVLSNYSAQIEALEVVTSRHPLNSQLPSYEGPAVCVVKQILQDLIGSSHTSNLCRCGRLRTRSKRSGTCFQEGSRRCRALIKSREEQSNARRVCECGLFISFIKKSGFCWRDAKHPSVPPKSCFQRREGRQGVVSYMLICSCGKLCSTDASCYAALSFICRESSREMCMWVVAVKQESSEEMLSIKEFFCSFSFLLEKAANSVQCGYATE